ncbi:hypothetical protein BYT27DRAFT_7202492 [Phlegmacium glaucopus]|nr:hypothetical protein BYT27DRAFT_7202492 [Phlegmacium glaucopus]
MHRPLLTKPYRGLHRRLLATNPQPPPKKVTGAGDDFRPPWVYVYSRLISYGIIPVVGIYSIFIYDFGEREHVFQPVRRWCANVINKIFTLSAAEERLLHDSQASMDAHLTKDTPATEC